MLTKWHKSYYDQIQECKKTDNRFIINRAPFITNNDIIVCIPFKTFCNSAACFEKRNQEGKE